MEDFGNKLGSILSALFEDKAFSLKCLFNITLVKFGERPSTFIDYYEYRDKLEHSNEFTEFISSDPDLRMGRFRTEKCIHDDFVIYNVKYENLFEEKDVSSLSSKEIHYIRGSRLGYPCPGDFAYHSERLRIEMNISLEYCPVEVYYYMCKDTIDNVNTAADIWYRFRIYAEALGYSLCLTIEKLS